jgi:PAS domain S-box-containing protein
MKTIDEARGVKDLPVIIANHQGIVVDVNELFEAVFGWKRSEIVGSTLAAIIPENLRDAHHLGFSRFLATGTPSLLNQPLALRAVTKDGREFDAEHYIIAEESNGEWKFAATIRPLVKP